MTLLGSGIINVLPLAGVVCLVLAFAVFFVVVVVITLVDSLGAFPILTLFIHGEGFVFLF